MRSVPVFVAVVASLLLPLAATRAAAAIPVKVLLVGDSLTVGGFGDAMQSFLLRKYGKNGVAIFASCGSSPEDWLSGTFVTNCGYRQTTPKDQILLEYQNGRRPRAVRTPKLRSLLAHYRPEVVIVQQGTNWMDALAATGRPEASRYRRIIADFVRELRRGNPTVAIFWVMPPASSKYPSRVHADVDSWINEASRTMGFYTINSRGITGAYRDGRTGGDGVHYGDAAGAAWARGVQTKLTQALKVLPLAGTAGRP
ncbi:MAG: SGNH/GDSL hydrolase family protein [Chthoniobacterales bacterium]